MKKTILLLSFVAAAYIMQAQTIVSTDPENRDAVLEEFTGRNCGFCPDGHVIAENLKTQHGDDFWIINLHAGGFSPSTYPNLNAPHSEKIRANFGVSSFPNGTVNRHNWGQGVTHGRSTWAAATTSALADPAYCNVGVEASIDQVTRIVTVNVEVYYTNDSPAASNYLSVAILGNGVIGSQSGGGSNYEHNHFLIEMINNNGPWGDEITTTSTGDLHAATYTWVLPETLPVDQGPELDPTTLEVVAFVTQGDKNDIINADGGDVASNPLFTNDVAIIDVSVEERTCDNTIAPSFILKNGGTENLTACEIEYSVNGGTASTYSWTGNLGTLESEEIELPEITFTLEEENELVVEAILTGDGNTANNTYEVTVDKAPTTKGKVFLNIDDGMFNTYFSWKLFDSEGTLVSFKDTIDIVDTLTVTDFECYDLYLYHRQGSGFRDGHMSLTDSDGQQLGYVDGNFHGETSVRFQTDELYVVEEQMPNVSNELIVYPNPTNGAFNLAFNLTNTQDVHVSIVDITGRVVYNKDMGAMTSGHQNISFKDVNLGNGVYIVIVEADSNKNYQKFQVAK